jgi:hypothetical protein
MANAESPDGKSKCHLGRARIALSSLVTSSCHRQVSRSNIDRLKRIFEREGCLRADAENYVPCVIDAESLRTALSLSSLTAQQIRLSGEDSLPPPLLLPDQSMISCLHGQHRLLAAREYLEEDDQWWTVDLYHTGKDFSQAKCVV